MSVDARQQTVGAMSCGAAPDEAFASNAAFAAQPGPQDAFAHGRAPHGPTQFHPSSISQATASRLAHRLGRLAVGALHAELTCSPEPCLVTPFDTVSHTDMDASTFLRSLFALRGYFVAVAQAGIDNAPFERLRQLGIDAETAMLHATGGV
ncbi:triphosphoribosyl-dephospho-CoA synthase, partial [Xanthomonas fragariae]|uniref:triphosphoribosyl-dephospho-CoA synthase n=1 Tax=Xanthomonas fragariae TaxID=48664 RepID=UPI001F3F21A1